MAAFIDSSDSWMALTSCSLPTIRISQMLRYFSTWRTQRMSMTSANSLLMRLSFLSTSSRISGVTSKLRPIMPVAIDTFTCSENLLAIRGGRDVEFVAVLGHGTAGNVNPLVVQNLHDFGIRQRLAGIFRLDVTLNFLFHRETGDVLARLRVDTAVEEVLHEEQSARRVHVFVGHDAGDRGLVHLDVVGDVAQHERPQIVDALLQKLALVLDDRLGHFVDGALPLV